MDDRRTLFVALGRGLGRGRGRGRGLGRGLGLGLDSSDARGEIAANAVDAAETGESCR